MNRAVYGLAIGSIVLTVGGLGPLQALDTGAKGGVKTTTDSLAGEATQPAAPSTAGGRVHRERSRKTSRSSGMKN